MKPDEQFQWAKHHAWVDWERKHTLQGIRIIEDRTMPPQTIRVMDNRRLLRSLFTHNTGDWDGSRLTEADL